MFNSIYHVLDICLPFTWIEYGFMKNALLAILLLAPVLGMVGTMIVNNRMAFFSDAIGHSTFTGLAIGSLLGMTDLSISAIIFSIIFAIFITFFKYKHTASPDTLISVFASIAVAFGIATLSSGGNFKKYSSFLIGDILGISQSDLLSLFAVFIIIIILWFFIFNRLFLLSLSHSLARSKKIKILLIESIFTIIIAVIITISIRWVGILLINSLLVLPAATSRNISKNIRQYNTISMSIALVSGISGLIISYYVNISTGATIVLVSGFLYILSLFIKGRFN